ncbi:hypothetical protein SNEBB_007924 [Seison nebaliae]|nr:hypothetical protein SNEBB_007924 [Seison nebaliae]
MNLNERSVRLSKSHANIIRNFVENFQRYSLHYERCEVTNTSTKSVTTEEVDGRKERKKDFEKSTIIRNVLSENYLFSIPLELLWIRKKISTLNHQTVHLPSQYNPRLLPQFERMMYSIQSLSIDGDWKKLRRNNQSKIGVFRLKRIPKELKNDRVTNNTSRMNINNNLEKMNLMQSFKLNENTLITNDIHLDLFYFHELKMLQIRNINFFQIFPPQMPNRNLILLNKFRQSIAILSWNHQIYHNRQSQQLETIEQEMVEQSVERERQRKREMDDGEKCEEERRVFCCICGCDYEEEESESISFIHDLLVGKRGNDVEDGNKQPKDENDLYSEAFLKWHVQQYSHLSKNIPMNQFENIHELTKRTEWNRLSYLDLRYNKLENCHQKELWKEAFVHTPLLKTLILSNNRLTNTEFLSASLFQFLENLDLSHNRLRSFDIDDNNPFHVDFALRTLNISSNLIGNINELDKLQTSLRQFDVSYNLLSRWNDIESISTCVHLRTINLIGNPIYYSKLFRPLFLQNIMDRSWFPQRTPLTYSHSPRIDQNSITSNFLLDNIPLTEKEFSQIGTGKQRTITESIQILNKQSGKRMKFFKRVMMKVKEVFVGDEQTNTVEFLQQSPQNQSRYLPKFVRQLSCESSEEFDNFQLNFQLNDSHKRDLMVRNINLDSSTTTGLHDDNDDDEEKEKDENGKEFFRIVHGSPTELSNESDDNMGTFNNDWIQEIMDHPPVIYSEDLCEYDKVHQPYKLEKKHEEFQIPQSLHHQNLPLLLKRRSKSLNISKKENGKLLDKIFSLRNIQIEYNPLSIDKEELNPIIRIDQEELEKEEDLESEKESNSLEITELTITSSKRANLKLHLLSNLGKYERSIYENIFHLINYKMRESQLEKKEVKYSKNIMKVFLYREEDIERIERHSLNYMKYEQSSDEEWKVVEHEREMECLFVYLSCSMIIFEIDVIEENVNSNKFENYLFLRHIFCYEQLKKIDFGIRNIDIILHFLLVPEKENVELFSAFHIISTHENYCENIYCSLIHQFQSMNNFIQTTKTNTDVDVKSENFFINFLFDECFLTQHCLEKTLRKDWPSLLNVLLPIPLTIEQIEQTKLLYFQRVKIKIQLTNSLDGSLEELEKFGYFLNNHIFTLPIFLCIWKFSNDVGNENVSSVRMSYLMINDIEYFYRPLATTIQLLFNYKSTNTNRIRN